MSSILTIFFLIFFQYLISSTSSSPPSSSTKSTKTTTTSSPQDITLIGTVGGYLYGVNTLTLEKIWSVNIGGPLLSAQEISRNLDYSMVPMIDGSLLYRGSKGVRSTSVTAKTLSENTPFHAQDGLLYNGEKFSKLYEIDLNDGQLLNDFTSSPSMPPFTKSESSTVIVGRVDYVIRAYNTATGQQEFNFTYGELSPISSRGQPLLHENSPKLSSSSTSNTELPKKSSSPNSSHYSFRKCRSSKSTSTALIYSAGAKVTPVNVDPEDYSTYTLTPHSMICTPKGEAVFAYTNGNISNPLYLDSPATFAYIFKNHSVRKQTTEDEVDVSPQFEDGSNFEEELSIPATYEDLDFVNDFDKDEFEDDLENDSHYYSMLLSQQNSDEEQYSAPSTPPETDRPLPFPQTSSSLSRSIPIYYQLEIPSATASNLLNSQTTLQISNNSESQDTEEKSNGSTMFPGSTDISPDISTSEIPSTTDSHSLMIYTSPITLQVSRPTPKGYHEPLIFPLSSSITVTLQTPISQNPPNSQLPGEDDDGYLLISESDVSSWVVGMRVPYPFSHPRYDPTKFITSQKSSLYTSPRLPSLPPVPIDHKHDLKEILSKFDYRYSAAFGEYEKCLSTPVSSLDDPNCNLTEFIEIEKLKLSNHYKFFQELHSSDQTSTSNSSLEANTMGLLILVGLFGGIIMTILLVLSFILYLNYINETPLTISEIITKLLAWKSFSSIPSSNKPHQHHNLEIFHDQELGRGSNGTVVLRGLFEGRRHVAVKKMVARFHNFERERSILSAADGHSNIVRYIQSIQEGDFYLLVLELCNMSLWNYLYQYCHTSTHPDTTTSTTTAGTSTSRTKRSFDQEESKSALLQICAGVSHLHSKNIIHRDLKPHNILLLNEKYLTESSSPNSWNLLSLGSYQFKISDMGLSKVLLDEDNDHEGIWTSTMHSTTTSRGGGGGGAGGGTSNNPNTIHWGGGTIGWSPPEVYQKKKNLYTLTHEDGSNTPSTAVAAAADIAYKADIFSLGCIFHFILIPGQHPFGESHERLNNILLNNSNLQQLKELNDSSIYDLISRMIHRNPLYRPTILQTLNHPYFWSYTQKLDFLNDFSDRIQYEIKYLENIVGFKHVDTVLLSTTGADTSTSMAKIDHIIYQKILNYRDYLSETLFIKMESIQNIFICSSPSSTSSPSPSPSSSSSSTTSTPSPTSPPNILEQCNYHQWEKNLPQSLIDDLLLRGKYNFTSRCDCLRMIRNKRRHRDEIPKSISSLFETDELYYLYFEKQYPGIFMSSIIMACKYLPSNDPLIQKYCQKLLGMFDYDIVEYDNNLKNLSHIIPPTSEGSDGTSTGTATSTIEGTSSVQDTGPECIHNDVTEALLASNHAMMMNTPGSIEKEKKSTSSSSSSSRHSASTSVSNFRTRMCHSGAACPYRAKGKCTFAHSEDELIVRKKKNSKN